MKLKVFNQLNPLFFVEFSWFPLGQINEAFTESSQGNKTPLG